MKKQTATSDIGVIVGLFILTILLRLPFQSEYLYHWDSVNMAFGVQEFNVIEEAPQYPGYIVYVALAQVVNIFVRDPQVTLVWISIIGSALASVAIFLLGREMFNRQVGLIAAMLLMTSPLVWFYSEIALPHTIDLFLITFSAFLLYRIMQGQMQHFLLTAVFLAIVGGFRQQDLLFLGPLILFAIYRTGIKAVLLFVLAGFVGTLVWFIPLVHYSGGLESYLRGSSAYSGRFFETTSLLAGAGMVGLRRNLISKLAPYTAYAWSLAAVPGLLYLLLKLPSNLQAWLRSRKVWFLVIWVLPSLLFYIVIHMGQQGLVFTFLPALMLLSAVGIVRLFAGRTGLQWAVTGVIVAVAAVLFILVPTSPLGETGPKILNYDTLRQHDQALGEQVAQVKAHINPDESVLLATDWRFLEYYLPEYALLRFTVGAKWEVNEGEIVGSEAEDHPLSAADLGLSLAGEHWQAVLVDPVLAPLSDPPLQSVDGTDLSYFLIGLEESLLNTGERLQIVPFEAP